MIIKFIKNRLKLDKKSTDSDLSEHKKTLITKLVNGKERDYVPIKTMIKDIMSTDLKTLKADDNFGYALELFTEYSITGSPVIDGGKVVGIISETDILRLMNQKNLSDPQKDEIKIRELQETKVKDVMTKNVFFVNQNDKLTDACKILAEKDVHRLLVLDDKKGLVGIVTMEDVMMGLSAEFFVDSIHKATDKVIGSEIDVLIMIIEKRKSVSVDELVKEMNLKQNHIENLAKILEKRGLIEIDYGIFGSPVLKVKS